MKKHALLIATLAMVASVAAHAGKGEHGHEPHGKKAHAYADCPPGLAKKGNGCMPPGQAKKYAAGQRLNYPYETLPPHMVRQLGLGNPGPGSEFVRVGNDVVKIAVGTGMVIEAMENLLGN